MLPVAILAGGLATRLRPITRTIPKAMITICGEPFAHWQMKKLAQAGVIDIVYCVGYKSEMIENFVGDGSKYGMNVEYSYDGPKQLGTGGAIIKALPYLGDKFMVLYGDSYLKIDYTKVQEAHEVSGKPALMTVYANNGKFDKSNVNFTGGVLRHYQKGNASIEMTHIDYGLSCFDVSVFSSYDSKIPLDVAQIFTDLASKDLLAGFEVEERFYEIGSRQGILDFAAYLERNQNEV